MYRNRFWVWAAILLVVSIVTSFSRVDIDGMLEHTNVITVEFRTDAAAKSIFTKKVSGVYIEEVNKDADFIIRQPSSQPVPGYSKIDDYIYSPIVVYAESGFDKPEDLFYRLGENSYFINMSQVADAVIKGKTLGELGITTKDDYKDIVLTLNLPSKGTLYYDKSIETLYIALNGNRVPTESERSALEDTVNALIEKSVECNDMMKKILNTNEFQLHIGPEFLSANLSNSYYNIFYFEKSVVVDYEVLVMDERSENILPTFLEKVIRNEKFSSTTYFRTSYAHNYAKIFGGLRSVEIIR